MSTFIYDMPYSKRLALMRMLDVDDTWKDLAGRIGFPAREVSLFELAHKRSGGSPTDDMLQKWGHSNATVDDLFVHLLSMNHYAACRELQSIVAPQYVHELDSRTKRGFENNAKFRQQTSDDGISSIGSCSTGSMSDSQSLPSRPGHNPQSLSMQTRPTGTPLPPYFSTQTNGHHAGYCCSDVRHMPVNADSYGAVGKASDTVKVQPPVSDHSYQSGKREPVESTCGPTTDITGPTDNHPVPHFGPVPISRPSALAHASLLTKAPPTTHSQGNGTLHAAMTYVQRYALAELEEATNYFSESNILGKGGFGTVYRGNIRRLNLDVAIKKITKENSHHELEALFMYHHEHIIPLRGYCHERNERCLVYQFMENGSLLNRLICEDKTPPLSWLQRVDILLGTAKAVHYLHSVQDKPMIHGDIKSANILLDSHFQAKVADFGLAKHATSGTTSSKYTYVSQYHPNIYGSRPYLPQDYLADTSQLHISTDTYSFGVVIFETCLGVKAGDAKTIPNNTKYPFLKDLMDSYRDSDRGLLTKLKDPKCPEWTNNQWIGTLNLGFDCTKLSKRKRPDMKQVVDLLMELRGVAIDVLRHQKKAASPSSQVSSMSASERSEHISFNSQGPGQSLRAGNYPPSSTGTMGPLSHQLARMKLGERLEPIPSLSANERELLSKDEPDYLHPGPGDDPDYLDMPGSEKGDYLHPNTALAADYENVARVRDVSLRRDDIGYKKAAFPNEDKFLAKDPDDLPYDKSKLAEPDMSEFSNRPKEPVESSLSSDIDPDDTKWLKCDSKKLAALEPKSTTCTEQISMAGALPPQLMSSEAYILQDFYDKNKQGSTPAKSLEDNNTTVASLDPAVELSQDLSDIDLSGDSSNIVASLEKADVVPNIYNRMPPSKPKKSTTCAPPPVQPTDIHGSQWYGSLQTKPPEHKVATYFNQAMTQHKGPSQVSAAKVTDRPPAPSPNLPAADTQNPARATPTPPMSLYLATGSSGNGEISFRGNPSEHAAKSDANRPEHKSFHASDSAGLYVPKKTGIQAQPQASSQAQAQASLPSHRDSKAQSHLDVEDSTELLRKKAKKPLPDCLATYLDNK